MKLLLILLLNIPLICISQDTYQINLGLEKISDNSVKYETTRIQQFSYNYLTKKYDYIGEKRKKIIIYFDYTYE